jgi:hypothetical protein
LGRRSLLFSSNGPWPLQLVDNFYFAHFNLPFLWELASG